MGLPAAGAPAAGGKAGEPLARAEEEAADAGGMGPGCPFSEGELLADLMPAAGFGGGALSSIAAAPDAEALDPELASLCAAPAPAAAVERGVPGAEVFGLPWKAGMSVAVVVDVALPRRERVPGVLAPDFLPLALGAALAGAPAAAGA